jgi:hypothetical protein
MKKFVVVACIVSIAIFSLAYDSFSQGAFVWYFEGTIEDLEIDFGSNVLPVELPVIGTLNVTYVEIVAEGTEHLVITESGQYNYWADLGLGEIYVTTANSNGNGKSKPIIIPIESASISEHYNLQDSSSEDPNLAPIDSVDLYFKATLVLDGEQTFDFTLKLKSGEVQIISS